MRRTCSLSAISLPPKYVRTRRELRSMCTPSFSRIRSSAAGTIGRASVSVISNLLPLDHRSGAGVPRARGHAARRIELKIPPSPEGGCREFSHCDLSERAVPLAKRQSDNSDIDTRRLETNEYLGCDCLHRIISSRLEPSIAFEAPKLQPRITI